MRSELGIVSSGPNDRLWIPRLRKWISDNKPLLDKIGVEAVVEPLATCDEGMQWRDGNPRERMLIMVGFRAADIGCLKSDVATCAEPIIVAADPGATPAAKCGSASVLIEGKPIYCGDVASQVRKSLIRNALQRNGIEIRKPLSDAELTGYLSLRYAVWKAIGYLRDECKLTRTEWEIDYWDRSAIPLCAITADGKVIGCTRLIQNFGDEQPAYVAKFQKLLEAANDPPLMKLFQFPNVPTHPFDVLFQFPGFGREFKDLMMRNVRMAEIGRVVVHPDWRGHCVSEVLVDTAVSLARQRNVSLLFLACHQELGPMYARCGFSPIEGLHSANFFNIQAPSIVMENRL